MRMATFIQVKLNFVHKMNCETNCRPDIKPNNVLCNLKSEEGVNKDESDIRFSEVLLAEFGNCVPSNSNYAKEGQPIGAAIFRGPEANLKLPWGIPTDIWSFGAMVCGYHFTRFLETLTN
jgi:serine/threonine protein kinase